MLSEAYVAASMTTDAPLLLCDTSWAGKCVSSAKRPGVQLCGAYSFA